MRECQRPEDIGLVTDIKSKGFGFAKSLTEDRLQHVFLNESRIASLTASGPPLNCLVRMKVVEQAGARYAATRVALLDLNNDADVNLLWGYVASLGMEEAAIRRLRLFSPRRAGSLPLLLLLALRPCKFDMDVAVWTDDIGIEIWRSSDSLPALHLAGDAIKRQVISGRVRDEPRVALKSLQVLIAADACPSDAAWLEALWAALPESWPEIVDLASGTFIEAAVAEPYTWACRAIETSRSLTPLWAPLISGLQSGSRTAEQIPEEWTALSAAPKEVLAALIPQKMPEFNRSLKALKRMRPAASSIAASSLRRGPALDATDRRLAETWIPREASEEARPALRVQMLSARLAEKCAKSYFERLGHEVKDIARLQLVGEEDTWQAMDLMIDSRHGVDVKNVRRSPNGGAFSSKWRAKQFKVDARGNQVLLCGVSSPYMPTFDEAPQKNETDDLLLVLGVTTSGEVHSLLKIFCGLHRVRANSATRLLELPAWAWDYPNSHYRERNTAFRALANRLRDMGSSPLADAARSAIPPILCSIWGCTPENTSTNPQQSAALAKIYEYSVRSRLVERSTFPRLPWLYLFLLHFWMSWRCSADEMDTRSLASLFEWQIPIPTRHDENHDYDDDHWLRLITKQPKLALLEKPSLASSIGIMDPANTVGILLQSLSRLEKSVSRELFLSISDLTLFESGVLAGRFPDGNHKTLLAHCGGKRLGGGECGYRPLIFGEHHTCDCGRLICPRCDSCSDSRFGRCMEQERRFTKRENKTNFTNRSGKWRK